jgi:hypothetical protein
MSEEMDPTVEYLSAETVLILVVVFGGYDGAILWQRRRAAMIGVWQ